MLSNHRGFPRSVFKLGLAGAPAILFIGFSTPARSACSVFEKTNLVNTSAHSLL